MKNTFEALAEQAKIKVLQITENNDTIARGIYLPEAVTSFCDNNISTISYPDTGVFVLFQGSHASSTADKYKPYINTNQKTNREIIFQSLNAAAQFVLGDKGHTNDWK